MSTKNYAILVEEPYSDAATKLVVEIYIHQFDMIMWRSALNEAQEEALKNIKNKKDSMISSVIYRFHGLLRNPVQTVTLGMLLEGIICELPKRCKYKIDYYEHCEFLDLVQTLNLEGIHVQQTL